MRLEEKEYTKSFDYSIWKRIFPFLKPYKKTVIMILVMNLFCSLVDIILPLFQRYAINHFIEGNTLTGIGFLPCFILWSSRFRVRRLSLLPGAACGSRWALERI